MSITPDMIITAITEAPTTADALNLIATYSRGVILATADQLYVDAAGHGMAWVRHHVVTEARA